MKQVVTKSIALAFLVSLVITRPALAYVDPNVGGMLFQALAAGFAVLTGILLLFSRQIRMAIGRVRRSLRGFYDIEPRQSGSSPSQISQDESEE